jgi:hypothetical protein
MSFTTKKRCALDGDIAFIGRLYCGGYKICLFTKILFSVFIVLLLLTSSGCYLLKKTRFTFADSVSSTATVLTPTELELLVDGGLEIWTNSTTLTNWTLWGDGPSLTKETTIKKAGTYSVKLTNAPGESAILVQDFQNAKGHNLAYWKGKTVIAGCWVYAESGRALLLIGDGIRNSASAYHSDIAGWEYLTCAYTVPLDATSIYPCFYISEGTPTTAYFDSATLFLADSGETSTASSGKPHLDYARSFICTPGNNANAVRFSIEARTSIVDERDKHNQIVDYYLSSPMLRESTFTTPPLLIGDGNNADFIPVFDSLAKNLVLFRRWPEVRPDAYRQVVASIKVWGTPIFRLRRPKGHLRELKTYSDIAHATAEGFPILARVKIWSWKIPMLYAYIEFPVKTMNVIPDSAPDFVNCKAGKLRCWQVDTGLVLFPDLDQYDSYDSKINSLSLAHIALNTFTSVDLAVDEEKPNRDNAKVYQFSKRIVDRPAKVTLFAVE